VLTCGLTTHVKKPNVDQVRVMPTGVTVFGFLTYALRHKLTSN